MDKNLPEVPADYLKMNTHSWCHTDRVTHALEKMPMDYGEEFLYHALSTAVASGFTNGCGAVNCL